MNTVNKPLENCDNEIFKIELTSVVTKYIHAKSKEHAEYLFMQKYYDPFDFSRRLEDIKIEVSGDNEYE